MIMQNPKIREIFKSIYDNRSFWGMLLAIVPLFAMLLFPTKRGVLSTFVGIISSSMAFNWACDIGQEVGATRQHTVTQMQKVRLVTYCLMF
jgi:hypothetical protein